jgi:hypothetical protein
MVAQKDSQMNIQPMSSDSDPIDQARELLARLSSGLPITAGGPDRDAAVANIAAQIATACHVRRVGDLLESLIDTMHTSGLENDLVAIIASQCTREA